MTTTEDTCRRLALHFTPEAKNTITAMRDRLAELRAAYGPHAPEFTDAAASLAFSLCQLISLGGNVAKDYELSLICSNEWLTYGVNFHESDRKARDAGEVPAGWVGVWSVNS